ncbi:MAG: response regulator, partial [Burkholderiales bacterium]|nr:response regulator [Burkholderiales bacterium]
NRDAAESLRMLLQLSGHVVAVAHTGHAAIDEARRFRPDVVLCDIGLPGMSGYEVARRLRREEGLETVRLIAVTGYGTDEDRDHAAAAGFDRHLRKPVEPGVLMDEFAGMLAARVAP